jgi:hypothetical protein
VLSNSPSFEHISNIFYDLKYPSYLLFHCEFIFK